MTARPTRVRIGPFTYRIEWPLICARPEDVEPLSAYVEHASLVISVCRTMEPLVQRKSLLHEIIHACNWITGHADASTEEEWVRSLAFPMLDFMRDNPRVVAWLMEE